MKCVYVRFSLSKQRSFFRKTPLNSCLMGLDHLYTGRAGGSARGKGYNNLFLPSSAVCPMWPIACVAGVKRGRGRGNLGARGRKERNACKETIVFFMFHAQIMSVKKEIGQN